MKITRNSVFETNSSSCHSLILNRLMDGNTNSLNGEKLTVDLQEYGWETVTYSSVQDKLNYVFSSLIYSYDDTLGELIEELLENQGVESIRIIDDNNVGWSIRSIEDFKEQYRKMNLDSFVDHQSFSYVAELSIQEIIYLITAPDSVVVTSNDNGGMEYIRVPEGIIEKIEERIGSEELESLQNRYEKSDKEWKGNYHRQNVLFDNDANEDGEWKSSPYSFGGVVKY